MEFTQIGIMVFGAPSIWLISRKEDWRKWGYVLGLCSMPFWFYTTCINRQWGIFILSFAYLYAWIQGIYNFIWLPMWYGADD